MKQFLTGAMAALMVGTTALAGATPSVARDYGYGYGGWGHHDHDDVGLAVGAGLLALFVGAAIASSNHAPSQQTAQYDGPPPPPPGDGYEPQGYAPPPAEAAPKMCTSEGQIWNPKLSKYELKMVQYAC